MIVRDLTEDDMERFADLAQEMVDESTWRRYVFDLERTIYLVLTIGAAEDGYARGFFNIDKLMGFFVGEVQRNPWFNLRQGVDHAFYVGRRYRHGPAAVDLLADFEQWARARGAARIQLTAAAMDDNTRASAFLAARGHKQYGYVHMKEF
jgi:GNAT superfamily N-acetyltransferase